ncbi:hypothetical protein A3Q56_08075 [Intoshia linei]|uniref:Uncharacterized protein n=1 Tax=Intoshia linei TaxID=1819745 RepID=A0A177ARS7_9BILA|nr:hypothetical protein A3Q56_08075 [Intoshia linei]
MDVSIYRSNCKDKHTKKSIKLINEIKEEIYSEGNKKPYKIMKILESQNFILPKKSQIVNYLDIFKKKNLDNLE